jgi:hypothetical protein
MDKLQKFFKSMEPGKITDTADLERLLAASWGDFAGSSGGGMKGWKLGSRMEKAVWQPQFYRSLSNVMAARSAARPERNFNIGR